MFGRAFFGARWFGPRYWGDGGALVPPEPPEVPTFAGGGGYLPHDKKRKYGLIPPRTKEELAVLVKAQREALGILPKPAQKRVVAAVKKAASKAAPLETLAPVVVELAQEFQFPAIDISEAIERAFSYRKALAEADQAVRQAQEQEEAESRAVEQAKIEAAAAQLAQQQHMARLLAEDEAILQMDTQAMQLVAMGLKQVLAALVAFAQDSGIAAPEEALGL